MLLVGEHRYFTVEQRNVEKNGEQKYIEDSLDIMMST